MSDVRYGKDAYDVANGADALILGDRVARVPRPRPEAPATA